MLKTGLSLEYFGISDIGLVRAQNEDSWEIVADQNLFVLADGMGGHRGGEVASKMAVEKVVEFFSEKKDTLKDPLNFMKKAFEGINKLIYTTSFQEKTLQGMGTTLLTLYIADEKAYYAHVGDSRLYLLREKLQPLTIDHSLLAELLLKEGEDISAEKRASCKHMLTKAVGTHPHVEPTFQFCSVQAGDFLLLSSDGLTNYVPEEEIENLLKEGKAALHSLKKIGENLVELAKGYGGGDNVTLILVAVEGTQK